MRFLAFQKQRPTMAQISCDLKIMRAKCALAVDFLAKGKKQISQDSNWLIMSSRISKSITEKESASISMLIKKKKSCEAVTCYSRSLRLAFRGENCLKAHPNGFLENYKRMDFFIS